MKRIVSTVLIFAVVYALNVPLCGDSRVPNLKFSNWNGSIDATNSTTAQICYNSDSLVISWNCIDSEVLAPYQHCNDPLYNADAVEIFIATPQTYPTKYFELQISPNSQLFFADISNPKGMCSNLGTEYQECGKATYIADLTPKGWQATLSINLNVIGRGKPSKQFWVNLFRIDKSTRLPTRYLAWQPTNTTTPCFHVPAAFQEISLV